MYAIFYLLKKPLASRTPRKTFFSISKRTSKLENWVPRNMPLQAAALAVAPLEKLATKNTFTPLSLRPRRDTHALYKGLSRLPLDSPSEAVAQKAKVGQWPRNTNRYRHPQHKSITAQSTRKKSTETNSSLSPNHKHCRAKHA